MVGPNKSTILFAPRRSPITLHYSANNRQMQDGDVVYMDYGADYEYYTR